MTDQNEMRRPTTPGWLRDVTLEIFDRQCLICQVDRPLDVAHLEDWTEIRQRVGEDVVAGFWEFHQPTNVVVLCANHHRLLDDQSETSVTLEIVTDRRSALLDRPGVGEKIRDLLCRLIAADLGKRRMMGGFSADINRLFPLLGWLQGAAACGTLPEPHDFAVVRNSGDVWSVSLKNASISAGDTVLGLPVWRDGRFVSSAEAGW